MPELPEVQTTVNGLNAKVKNLVIQDIWTSYNSPFHRGKDNIKNPKYFTDFKKKVVGNKIVSAERQGKNILIHLSNGNTMLAHMKMTGHFLYGKYILRAQIWKPETKNGPLIDPYNRHVRLVFILSNGNHLAFSDSRKFAKVFIFETSNRHKIEDLMHLGPDALSKELNIDLFEKRLLLKPHWKIKQTLMNQEIISGIGNIYSDEMLWKSGIHPASITSKIPAKKLAELFKAMKEVLKKGIDFGGDSDSDYRNIVGEPGKFQHRHNAYRRTGLPCPKKDGGKIERIIVAARSAHFCPKHQKLFR